MTSRMEIDVGWAGAVGLDRRHQGDYNILLAFQGFTATLFTIRTGIGPGFTELVTGIPSKRTAGLYVDPYWNGGLIRVRVEKLTSGSWPEQMVFHLLNGV